MRYKAFFSAWLVLFILISFPAGAADNMSTLQPKAYVKQPEIVFPATPEGKELHHTFVIENIGDAPLQILKVKTG